MPPPKALLVGAAVTAPRLQQHQKHRRRRPTGRIHRPSSAAAAAICDLLLLAAVFVALSPQIVTTGPFALAAGGSSSSRSKTGTTVTVGGVSVEVGKEVGEQGSRSTVYNAKHGSADVIYKEALPSFEIGRGEVEATKAAGQLISAEGNKMVQKKVGTTGLADWLKTQQKSPEARSKYLLKGENPADHRNKVKLSDAIYGPMAKQQRDAGYVHYDTVPANIRVHASPRDKPGVVPKVELIDWGISEKVNHQETVEGAEPYHPLEIGGACSRAGFQFRAATRALFRRAGRGGGGGRRAACARPAPSSSSSKAVAARSKGKRQDVPKRGGGGGEAGGEIGGSSKSAVTTSKAPATKVGGGNGGENGGKQQRPAASKKSAAAVAAKPASGGAARGGKGK